MKIIEIKCLTNVLALSSFSVFGQKENSKDYFAMKKMIHDNFEFAEKTVFYKFLLRKGFNPQNQ